VPTGHVVDDRVHAAFFEMVVQAGRIGGGDDEATPDFYTHALKTAGMTADQVNSDPGRKFVGAV
jgi:hypothetical protein